jgi:hypothetical protein
MLDMLQDGIQKEELGAETLGRQPAAVAGFLADLRKASARGSLGCYQADAGGDQAGIGRGAARFLRHPFGSRIGGGRHRAALIHLLFDQ